MRSFVHLAGLTAVALFLTGLVSTEARPPAAKRQYYDQKWTYYQPGKYYYKRYHYKPKATDVKYKQQVVVYKPQKTKDYVYWYNPDTKKYWARCPTVNNPTYGQEVKKGKDYWSILPQNDRQASLNKIDDSKFGQMTQQSPQIPQSNDNTKIDCPPTQLPED
jgi:hypothetical protein